MWHKTRQILLSPPWEEADAPPTPRSNPFSLCCLPTEVAFVPRAASLLGQPAPRAFFMWLRMLGSALKQTLEQRWQLATEGQLRRPLVPVVLDNPFQSISLPGRCLQGVGSTFPALGQGQGRSLCQEGPTGVFSYCKLSYALW